MSEIKVITSVQRRCRWTAEEKRVMVEEAEQPGMSTCAVARKYDIHPNLLFTWRRLMRQGTLRSVLRLIIVGNPMAWLMPLSRLLNGIMFI